MSEHEGRLFDPSAAWRPAGSVGPDTDAEGVPRSPEELPEAAPAAEEPSHLAEEPEEGSNTPEAADAPDEGSAAPEAVEATAARAPWVPPTWGAPPSSAATAPVRQYPPPAGAPWSGAAPTQHLPYAVPPTPAAGSAVPSRPGPQAYPGQPAHPAYPGQPAHPAYPGQPVSPAPRVTRPPVVVPPTNVSAVALLVASILGIFATGIIGPPSAVIAVLALRDNATDHPKALERAKTGWIVFAVNAAVGVVLLASFVWWWRNR